MQSRAIYERRIHQFRETVYNSRYPATQIMSAAIVVDKKNPIPYAQALKTRFHPIAIGSKWGPKWASAWFTFKGQVPKAWTGKEIAALIDTGGEACVWKNGAPDMGLTGKFEYGWPLKNAQKRLYPLFKKARGSERVSLLVEAAGTGLFGNQREVVYRLNLCSLAVVDRKAWALDIDLTVLEDLMLGLPEQSVRRKRLLFGLNEAANAYAEGKGVDACLAITKKLLAIPAASSALTAYGIGHAHLDLGWLWPIRETIRKGGRTFSTALKLMDEYPQYKFGASQPQLFQWMKEQYPTLYARVKQAVAKKRLECQGVMWVEADTNITGGESLVRQCLYGKRFFKQEFGVVVDNLWLPDVFGYSAALPQILKKCGVNYFMTQKISWNESNPFPHYTFNWIGIDGTGILTHFLPAHGYNATNKPQELMAAQDRFSQADITSAFLQLYGVGDGGGGPSRKHIEFGLCQKNSEGVPRFTFSFAKDFFKTMAAIPEKKLPVWKGELYLELHRGTYTTQALVKKQNRALEHKLRNAEFFCAIAPAKYPKAQLEKTWKKVLLNQFHDIIPGSSIAWVYKDAHALYEECHNELNEITGRALRALHGAPAARAHFFAVWNTLSWQRAATLTLPLPDNGPWSASGPDGMLLPCIKKGNSLQVRVTLPSMGYAAVHLVRTPPEPIISTLTVRESLLENSLVRVRLGANGTIVSLFDKELKREMLQGAANHLLLWEDIPYEWDAWDVSHYYKETKPVQATLVSRSIVEKTPLRVTVRQKLTVGASVIEQEISLCEKSKLVTIKNRVTWNERHKLLKVHAAAALQPLEASYEVQYGVVRRPTHQNTSWDQARFEVCAHRFADLSSTDFGLALLNDSKFGHCCPGNAIELSLLRSPVNPDETADIGVHEFTYAYYPHTGDLTHSDVLHKAHELNTPAIVHPVARPPATPLRRSFALTQGTVKIETVKKAEDTDAIVVRLYETMGAHATTVLSWDLPLATAAEANMLEQPETNVAVRNHSCKLSFTPFEIKTLVLK